MTSLFKKLSILIFGASALIPVQVNAQHFLIPQTALVQHAGSIGYNTIGIGYNLFGNKLGSLDLTYGHVPKSKGGKLDIFAAKFAYRPINVKLGEFGVLNVINPGAFISYHPGGKFHTTLDRDQYPAGYYWWSSAVRFHLSASTELRVNTPKKWSRTGIEQISVYSEFNTNELYAVSWFINREHLPLRDIFKLGFGVKAYF